MFTGLVEDVGTISALSIKNRSAVLAVKTKLPLSSLPRGASVAVNGACLTVVQKSHKTFTVDVSPETLKRTSLERLTVGDGVNLERPMRLADRLGGHLVTGHVDGLAEIAAISKQGEFTVITFDLPAALGSVLVAKGSVAVDGISLTVNACGRKSFSVAIIPFTLQHTNLRTHRVGDKVNIETDLIGKYVQNLLRHRAR